MHIWHQHAKLHAQSAHQISTPYPNQTTTHSPYKHISIKYGQTLQESFIDSSDHLTPLDIKNIQDIVGKHLYYGSAVDPTLAVAFSVIASQQAKGTGSLKQACQQLLDYVATHPHIAVQFLASDMVLAIHTDASYLSEPNAKSCTAMHFYLTNWDNPDLNNWAILTLSSIIKHVMALASEAKLTALFYGCKHGTSLSIALEEMGYCQPLPLITTDNSTTTSLTSDTTKSKAFKFMDMRWHWLKCQQAQQHFCKCGADNHAGYHFKHHLGMYHQSARHHYVLVPIPTNN